MTLFKSGLRRTSPEWVLKSWLKVLEKSLNFFPPKLWPPCKAIGRQWYWSCEYREFSHIVYDAYHTRKPGVEFLLRSVHRSMSSRKNSYLHCIFRLQSSLETKTMISRPRQWSWDQYHVLETKTVISRDQDHDLETTVIWRPRPWFWDQDCGLESKIMISRRRPWSRNHVNEIRCCYIALPAVLLFQRCKAGTGCWPREDVQLTEFSCRYLAATAADDADDDGGGGGGNPGREGRW